MGGTGGKLAGQNGVMLDALQRGPRTATELNRMGIGRPNSRAAELRRRGHAVVCEFDSKQKGAARYVYRLLDDAPIQADAGAGNLASQGGASSSSTRTALSPGPGSAPLHPGRGCCSTSAEESTAAAFSWSPQPDDAGRASRLDPALLLRQFDGEQMSLLGAA
jgi:hypothetical protein